ncbi:MAG: protein kinase [Acidobacteria bacterium]|nr:protein kinase [Acidobacteriota bacterium]MCB9397418.1 protein kinase [Acidobacteriota bacterium]
MNSSSSHPNQAYPEVHTRLQKVLGKTYRVHRIIEVKPVLVEAVVENLQNQEWLHGRFYSVRSEDFETVKQLWFEHAFMVEGTNHDLLQTPIGLRQIGSELAFVSQHNPYLSLEQWIRTAGPMPHQMACRLTIELIKALEAVYAKGGAHFQLKPGDIQLDGRGTISLKNFALFDFEQALAKTVGLEPLMDPRVTAPEQLLGEDLTISADIYAVGVILYYMLTGAYPFSGDFESVKQAALNGAPQNPQALNPDLPVGVMRILARAIASAKKQRFSHFSEFKQALAYLLPVAERASILSLPGGEESHLDEAERSKIMADLDQARGALRNGELDQASTLLDAILMMNGRHPDALKLNRELRIQVDGPQIKEAIQAAKHHIEHQALPEAMQCLNRVFDLDQANKEGWKLHQFIRDQIGPTEIDPPVLDVEHWKAAAQALTTRDRNVMADNVWALLRSIDPMLAPATKPKGAPPQTVEARLQELQTMPLQAIKRTAPADTDDFQTRPMTPRDQKEEEQRFIQETLVQPLSEIQAMVDEDLQQTELELTVASIQNQMANKQFQEAIQSSKVALEKYPDDAVLKSLQDHATTQLREQTLQRGIEKIYHLIKKQDYKAVNQVAQGILKIAPNHPEALKALQYAQSQMSTGRELVHFLREVNQLEEQGAFQAALGLIEKEEHRFRDVPEFAALKERIRGKQEKEAELEWRLLEAQRMIQKGNMDGAKTKIYQILDIFPNAPKAHQLLDSIGAGQTMAFAKEKELLRSEEQTELLPVIKPSEPPPPPMPPPPPKAEPPILHADPALKAAPVKVPKSKGKSKLPLILVGVFVLLAAGAGGFWFLQRQKQIKANETAYSAAAQLEDQGQWPEALNAWSQLVDQAPDFKDVEKRKQSLQDRINQRATNIKNYLERARAYRRDGIVYDSSSENAIAYYQRVLGIDPNQSDAQNEIAEILAEMKERSHLLFEEEKAEEAQNLYGQIKKIDPKFEDAEFETSMKDYLYETKIAPQIEQLDKQLARKNWDEAFEITAAIHEIETQVPEVQEKWDAVFVDLQTKMQAAQDKNRQEEVLKNLELMCRIRPEDQALADQRNLLSRELNNSKIKNLESQIETASNRKDWVKAGTLANDLSRLDSENPLIAETLDTAINKLEDELRSIKDSQPRKAVSVCDGLIKIANQARHREERKRLANMVKEFDTQQTAITGNFNYSSDELATRFDSFLSKFPSFKSEAAYQDVQALRKRVDEEKTQLQNMVAWESKVRDDRSVPFQDILDRIQKTKFFFPFATNTAKELIKTYKDKIDKYEGPVTIVLKQGKSLPAASDVGNKAPEGYCEIEFSGSVCKTEAIDNNYNPVWNHTCSFQAKAGSSIVIRLYDDNKFGKAQLLGSLKVEKLPESGKDLALKSPEGWTLILDIRRER